MVDPVGEATDRLYAVPPRRFVAERDAAVAAARDAGDSAAAAALGKLRRPTVAAWLVNLLALRRPELLAELAELATSLRAAQRERDGERLRELTGRRRGAVSSLVATARSLAQEEEPELAAGKLPLAEVESMLTAALADDEVAEALRSGRLVRPVTATGFGELPRATLRLVQGGAAAAGDSVAGAAGVDEDRIAAELADARAAAAAAATELERATAAERAAKQELATLDAELAELTARRARAAGTLTEAGRASLEARRAVAAARRRVGEAEAASAALTPDADPR